MEEIDDIALWLESQPTYGENIETLCKLYINSKFPGIKDLSISYDKGLKLHYNDNRYAFSEVYCAVRDFVIEGAKT